MHPPSEQDVHLSSSPIADWCLFRAHILIVDRFIDS